MPDEPARGAIEGVVTKWNADEGYGFIRSVNPLGTDCWVGRTGIGIDVEKLMEGQKVFFDSVPSEKKPGMFVAKNVTGPAVVKGDGCLAANIKGPQQGLVTKWEAEKSYGFITPAVGGLGVFVRRDGLGARAAAEVLLIEGLACWFEIVISLGAKARGKWQAKNVSGPAVLHRAEHFKPGDLAVYREGSECRDKNSKDQEGGWVLPAGLAATVVRVEGDNLVLNNGVCHSGLLHAAYWWRKSFIKVEVGGDQGVKRRRNIEDTLGIRLTQNLRIRKVERGQAGAKCGLQEDWTVRWVGGEEVNNDRDCEKAWKKAGGDTFDVLILLPCALRNASATTATAPAAAAAAATAARAGRADARSRSRGRDRQRRDGSRNRRGSRERRGGGKRSRDRSRGRRSRQRRRSRGRDRDRRSSSRSSSSSSSSSSKRRRRKKHKKKKKKSKKVKKSKKEKKRASSSSGSLSPQAEGAKVPL